ncbi:MAG: NADPH-dependent FMN reductase [Actinomycetota bacterium]
MSDAPLELVAVIGSLRAASVHRAVFDAATGLTPEGVTLREVPVAEVPFYNGDVEDAGDPPSVAELKAMVADADGLVFITPEYNGGVPAVTKNALDWLSRPYGSGAIAGKPVLIVAATPGRHDAPRVREALTFNATVAGGRVQPETLGLSSISRRMDDGVVTDTDARDEITAALAAFVEFVRTPPPAED